MEFYNGILCISGTELIRTEANPLGIMPLGTYISLVSRGKINRVRRANRETPALIEFDTMPTKYKEMILKVHPDPRVEAATAPFIKRITIDTKAQNYYLDPEQCGVQLSVEVAAKYAVEASVYNALHKVLTDMRSARAHSPGKTSGVWNYGVECIDSIREAYESNYGVKFPNNPRSLKKRYDKYLNEGYAGLVHSGHGNINRNVVKDELSEAVLMTLLAKDKQFDLEVIANAYNIWAEEAERKPMSARTVRDFLERNDEKIRMFRHGKAAYNNKYDQVISRNRPSAPLMLINSDDNHLDAYFKINMIVKDRKGKPKQVKTDYYRPKLYVVMDAFNDYILGYAYGPEITKEVIKEAYRNAMNHIKELTGSYCGFGQIVADRWGIGVTGTPTDLQQFFEAQAIFTPAGHKNARTKTIEAAFGTIWHKVLKLMSNYSGPGITAKSKLSEESIEGNKANFPKIDDSATYIANFIEALRNYEWKKSGRTRKEMWLENFAKHGIAQERGISDLTYLSMHGTQTARPVTPSSKGVEITIDGVKYLYDIPGELYREVIGRSAQVSYDPADMSRILCDAGKGGRFVATANNKMPMALGDMQEGDGTRLHHLLDTKRQRKIEVEDEMNAYRSLVAACQIDPDGLLRQGTLGKEQRFKAEGLVNVPPAAREETINIYNHM